MAYRDGKVDRKQNTLTYTYPENANMYELGYLQQELPPALNAKKDGDQPGDGSR